MNIGEPEREIQVPAPVFIPETEPVADPTPAEPVRVPGPLVPVPA